MRVNYFLIGILLVFLIGFSAGAEISSADVNVYYFYRPGCLHCANVADSGILEKVGGFGGVNLQELNVLDENGREKVFEFAEILGLETDNLGVPFAVIESGGKYSYLKGEDSIIEKLEESVLNFQGFNPVEPDGLKKITLWSLVGAAAVDSINPCAFGVLIFLMLSLLKIGSSKRALKAGLIYTFVVFAVYFSAGFGIFSAIQSFTSLTKGIYLTAGVLVLGLGLWQFKDVFLPKVGPALQISPKVKPIIEKIIYNGTIPAIILLGVIVSLFELPCTGGIYLAILTMMSKNGTFAISYLLIYNFIFVLPLIVLTLLIYKGTSPEVLQKWTSREKKWMKFAAGAVMVGLGIYILVF